MVQALRTSLRYGGLRQGGLQPGLGGDSIFATASLDLNFAVNKNLGTLVDATTGTNLIDFTRASSGTYVGSDGLIKTATTNLLLRSEEFETAGIWLAGGSSFVTPNAIEAPNGTLTADIYTTTGAGESTYQNVTVVPSTEYVFSLYVRLGTMSAVNYKIAVYNNTSPSFIAIDVAPTQVPTSTGWTRIDYKFTTPSGCTSARVYPFRNSVVISSSTVYFWGAQLEQSSTVGEYIPTTSTINSAPRFDHDPVTGECLGLLVEEQRVNYCLQSEAFGTSPWAASNVTITANTETSPAATLTADTLAATSANGTVTQPVTTTAIAMTFSVYLKRKTGTGNIDITADGTTWVTQTINDTTWTRCIVTQTAVAGTSNPGVRIVTSGDEVYAWGGQYE